MAVSANRLELLQIADAVAREKVIDRADRAGRDGGRHRRRRPARATAPRPRSMPRSTPRPARCASRAICTSSTRSTTTATEIALVDAQRCNPAAQVGDSIADTLPPFDFGRIAAQSAKQVIVQKVREAERDRQYDEFKDRIGEIVNGVVKRVEYGNVIVDLGRGEGIVRRDELIPREAFRPGDRIRAYVYDVRREQRGPQIFLSRTHPQFMAKLFAQEVPEIYDGIIEVKAVARDPGSRAKIAVISRDSSIDPVGACVGMRGSRVQAVVGELQGEKIDIIPWSPDVATFIVNALQPAEVAKVVLDEDAERIEVVVPDDQLSLAIGRRGQNVRLASQLTGWDIDILTEAEESERRQKEFQSRTHDLHGSARRRRGGRPAARLRRLPHGRGTRLCRALRARLDRRLRRGHRDRDPEPARSDYLARIEAEFDARAPGARRRRRAEGGRRRHHRDARQARRERRQDRRGSRRLRHRRSRRLERAQGWRDDPLRRHSSTGSRSRARRPRPSIMAARVKAGWIEAPAEVEPARSNETRRRGGRGVSRRLSRQDGAGVARQVRVWTARTARSGCASRRASRARSTS